MAVIGIDLGGTKIAAALYETTGEMYCKTVRMLHDASGKAVAELIVDVIQELHHNNIGVSIESIGICVPGIAHADTETVWAPNIPGWEDFPLKKYIEEAMGEGNPVRVAIESDRTCYILGECWKGAAQGCRNAIYIAVGTGIGAGIMVDGHVLHGANDIAGAIGWMGLQNPYIEQYIPVGCFEYYASGNGIATQARHALRCARNYTGVLSVRPVNSITSYDVFAAYDMGDYIANKVLEKAIEMWGMGSANLVSIFNPERVIFGGGVFGPASRFMRRIYDEACKWGQPIAMQRVEYCASTVKGEAAMLGAAYLAIQNIKRS